MAFMRRDLLDRPEDTYRGRGEEGNPRSPVAPAADRIDTLLELLDLARGPAWHEEASCRVFPELSWFPERGETTVDARMVCQACTVRDECAAAGARERFGIWGGASRSRPNRAARAAPGRVTDSSLIDAVHGA